MTPSRHIRNIATQALIRHARDERGAIHEHCARRPLPVETRGAVACRSTLPLPMSPLLPRHAIDTPRPKILAIPMRVDVYA